jgi:hypothetical protein
MSIVSKNRGFGETYDRALCDALQNAKIEDHFWNSCNRAITAMLTSTVGSNYRGSADVLMMRSDEGARETRDVLLFFWLPGAVDGKREFPA